MQSKPLLPAEPQSPEEAVIGLLMQAGRRLRTRHPEDQVDPSTFPLAKQLMCHDAMRLSDLATAVELDASTVSRQVKQLEDKGIVERTPDPADGRASLIGMTPHGQQVMHAGMRRRVERIKSVLEPWNEHDRAQLQQLLTRLATDLREANDLHESASR
jgi:DNA-binding MarR family transcriptional regulator